MTISKKLGFSSIVITLAVAIFLGASVFLVYQLQASQEKQQLSQKINDMSFQMALLQSEYLAHPSEQLKGQWMDTKEVQTRILDQGKHLFVLPEEKALFEKTSAVLQDSTVLFGELVYNIDNGWDQAMVKELNDRLTANTQTQVSNALNLAELGSREAADALRTLEFVIVVLAIIILAILIGSYVMVRSIIKSLNLLGKGARTIAEGNLSYNLNIKSKDEIGQLAEAFNTMAVKLESFYSGLEEKIAERTIELEAEKAKAEAILLSIADGLVALDLQGRIMLVNKGFENMLGWKEEEMLGKKLVDAMPLLNEAGKVIPESQKVLTKVLLGTTAMVKDIPNTQYFYKKKDGSLLLVTFNAAPIMLGKKIIGAVAVFRDVTKEKEIDKAKTEFVSLASHQLRTPLSTINWYTEMLLAGDAGKLKDKQKEYLSEIYTGNQRMVELVDALLSVSRLELGTFMVEPEQTNITELIESEINEQKPQIEKRQIKVSSSFQENNFTVKTDPKLLRMIIQNLLSNAVKYTPIGGEVKTEVTFSKLRGNMLDALIKISDTGYGIPDNQKDKIFSKLFRADNVREKDTEGTGLGLYIVRLIIEHSGGKIWFESQENKGTTFYLTLPLEVVSK